MSKVDIRHFDYGRMAVLDAAMWRSYYNHQFFKLFVQLIKLVKTQLGFGWFLTIRLAFYSGWAAAYYRVHRQRGVDNSRVIKNLTKFYGLISANSLRPFDHKKAAKLELKWWDVHRSSYENNPALEQSLAEGAAAVYDVAPSSLKTYAHYRAVAMILPRHQGDDQDTPTDWKEIERLLTKAWQALHAVVQK